ncbi:MAG TPA: AtpZ/AtpI family protein [Candidatus Ozemobacteraceae bacterium]|nr:AtpZ/AtpI family protein [Candidatus Ozemobacteraceae bacterium]
MAERRPDEHPLEGLSKKLSERYERRRHRDEAWAAGFWSGLRILGRAGWSVVIPGLIGTAAGLWIDNRWPSVIPWSVVGLGGGTVLGFASLWEWLSQEHRNLAGRAKGGDKDDSRS